MQKIFLVLFLMFILQACKKPLKEYTLNDGMTIQLFSDSTFTQDIRLLERKYSVSGNWSDTTAEGGSFTTKTIAEGMQPEVVTLYKIVNDKAIPQE